MVLKRRNFRVLDTWEPRRVEFVVGQPAAQVLKRPTADAVYWQVSGNGIVVALINFGVEILGILSFSILLVEPRTQVCMSAVRQRSKAGLTYSLMPMAKSFLMAALEYSFLPFTHSSLITANSPSFSLSASSAAARLVSMSSAMPLICRRKARDFDFSDASSASMSSFVRGSPLWTTDEG